MTIDSKDAIARAWVEKWRELERRTIRRPGWSHRPGPDDGLPRGVIWGSIFAGILWCVIWGVVWLVWL